MVRDPISVAARVELTALLDVPLVQPGDDLAELAAAALARANVTPRDGDVLSVTSKIVSRAEGRYADLALVTPSPRALELAAVTGKDPRAVELVLRESQAVSRAAPGALVVRHRLGFVSADAGIDQSNVPPPSRAGLTGAGPFVLLLPESPDASAARIRDGLFARTGARLGVIVTDSFGRPFRVGTVGVAIGVASVPPVWDQRGDPDLFGRTLQRTITAFADQIAAACDLVAGQAAEARPMVHVRGLRFPSGDFRAAALCRPPESDLYAG